MDPTNVHSYDGKIINTLKLNIVPEEEKDLRLQELMDLLTDPRAKNSMRIIINSFGTSQNIDTTNNLISDLLLLSCWEYRHLDGFIKNLEEQLLDMITGFCPQGRTHRLYQLLLAYSF